MHLEISFGRVLKQLRIDRGLTQEDLGFEAGVSRNYVSQLELGAKSPSLRTIHGLCQALQVSLAEVMQRLEQEMARAAQGRRVAGKWR